MKREKSTRVKKRVELFNQLDDLLMDFLIEGEAKKKVKTKKRRSHRQLVDSQLLDGLSISHQRLGSHQRLDSHNSQLENNKSQLEKLKSHLVSQSQDYEQKSVPHGQIQNDPSQREALRELNREVQQGLQYKEILYPQNISQYSQKSPQRLPQYAQLQKTPPRNHYRNDLPIPIPYPTKHRDDQEDIPTPSSYDETDLLDSDLSLSRFKRNNSTKSNRTLVSSQTLQSINSVSTDITVPDQFDTKTYQRIPPPPPDYRLHNHLNNKKNNLINVLDCLEEVQQHEEEMVERQLMQILDEIQDSVAYSTYKVRLAFPGHR